MQELINRIQEFYNEKPENGAGGVLHIVTDDGNMEDSSIDFCIELAEKDGDMEAIAIANDIKALPFEERERLYELFWE